MTDVSALKEQKLGVGGGQSEHDELFKMRQSGKTSASRSPDEWTLATRRNHGEEQPGRMDGSSDILGWGSGPERMKIVETEEIDVRKASR